jgi:predicted small lipoprotein YifL
MSIQRAKDQFRPEPGEGSEEFITDGDMDTAVDELQAAWRDDDAALLAQAAKTLADELHLFEQNLGATLSHDLPVEDILNDPPTLGAHDVDRVWIVGTAPTGAWAGHANEIAEWTGTAWSFEAPNEKDARLVEADGKVYRWGPSTSGPWTKGAAIPVHDAPPADAKYGDYVIIGAHPTAGWSGIGGSGDLVVRGGSSWVGAQFAEPPTDTPPANPALTNHYFFMTGSNPTGDWAGHPDEVANWRANRWASFSSKERVWPGSDGFVYTRPYVWAPVHDTAVMSLSGGTLTGPLYLPAGAPTQKTQAVTKDYVDTKVGTGISVGAADIVIDRARPLVVLSPAVGATATATPPRAADNAGVVLTVVNAGNGKVAVAGLVSAPLPGHGQVRLYSDGTTWRVLDGVYTERLATGERQFQWNPADTAWRCVFSDTGWWNMAPIATVPADMHLQGTDGIRVKREGSLVTVYFAARSDAVGRVEGWFLTNDQMAGFRPTHNFNRDYLRDEASPTTDVVRLTVANGYGLKLSANQKTTGDAGAFAIGEAMYHTVDPWPTTVPPGVTVAAPGA